MALIRAFPAQSSARTVRSAEIAQVGVQSVSSWTYESTTFVGVVVRNRRRVRQLLEDGTANMAVDHITIDIHDVEDRTS